MTELDTTERFAAALTALREGAGLSVRDLARAIGMPASTVGGYCSGRHLPPATRPEVLVELLGAVGVPPEQHAPWLDALRRLHARRLPPGTGRHPFPGLSAFGPDDAAHFFGRERDALALLALVEQAPVTVVVGASGSGKSSLVQAGLLPLLPGSRTVAVVHPGPPPHAEVHAAVARLSTAAAADPSAPAGSPALLVVDQVEQMWTLGADPSARDELLDLLARACGVAPADPDTPGRAPTVRLVLAVRSDFYASLAEVDWLRAALRSAQFLVEPLDREALTHTIQGPARVFGITVEPGLVSQIVGDALRGAGPTGAVLPHLSHTLAMMWERARRRTLTAADYDAVGGIAGALAKTADEAYAELAPERREIARQALLRLVVVDEATAPVAGVVSLGDLDQATREVLEHFAAYRIVTVDGTVDGTEARLSHEAVIGSWRQLGDWIAADRDRLVVARMVSRESAAWVAADRDPALLLRGSRLEAADELPVQTRLTLAERDFVAASVAAERAQTARRAAAHRRTRRLLVATSVLAAAALIMTVGLVVSQRTITQERDTAQRNARLAQSRQLGVLSNVVARTDPVAAAQLAVAGYQQGSTVESRSALFARSAAPRLGHLDGPAGARIVRAAPGRPLVASGGAGPGIDLVDLSGPAPRRAGHLVTGGADDTCFALAFAPDGQRLAYVNRVGLVRLVDLTDPAAPRELPGPAQVPPPAPADLDYALTFSTDGTELLVGTGSHGILRFAVPTGMPPTPLPGMPAAGPASGPVLALTALSGGRVVAGGAKGAVSVWAAGAAAPSATTALRDGLVVTLAAHGDDVYAGQRGGNRAYRVPLTEAGFGAPVELAAFDSWVNTVAVSADGATIAVGSSDHTVRTFGGDGRGSRSLRLVENVASVDFVAGRLVIGLTDGQLVVCRDVAPAADESSTTGYFAAWSGDGRRMASFVYSSKNPQVRLWDSSDPLALRLLTTIRPTSTHAVPSGTGDISADGRLLAAGTIDGAVLVWEVTDPGAPRLILDAKVAQDTVQQVTFLDDGVLLVASDDRSARLVRWRPGASPEISRSFVGATNSVFSADAHRGRELLATASYDGTARLYHLGTGQPGQGEAASEQTPVGSIVGIGNCYAVEFSVDGTRLFVAGEERGVRVYDVRDPAKPVLLQTLATSSSVWQLRVGSGGRLAAAGSDGTVTVWLSTGAAAELSGDAVTEVGSTGGGTAEGAAYALWAALPGTASMMGVAWAPDGRHLAAVGQAAQLWVWAVEPRVAVGDICAAAGDPVGASRWSALLTDQTYQQPCP